jgi:hypothetical protein
MLPTSPMRSTPGFRPSTRHCGAASATGRYTEAKAADRRRRRPTDRS